MRYTINAPYKELTHTDSYSIAYSIFLRYCCELVNSGMSTKDVWVKDNNTDELLHIGRE